MILSALRVVLCLTQCPVFFVPVSAEMRDKLRRWREENCRNSEQVVRVGEELLAEHGSRLGDDGEDWTCVLPGGCPWGWGDGCGDGRGSEAG